MSAPQNRVHGDPQAGPVRTPNTAWVSDLGRARRPGPRQRPPKAENLKEQTIAIHAGSMDDPATGAVGTPIYQNTTFLLDDETYQAVDEGYARDRFLYTRYGNPNQWAVQEKLAALEGAESAVVFSSGMAAIAATLYALVDKGGHIVASNELYGGTYALLQQELPRLGIPVSFVDSRDLTAVAAALRPETQLLFFEAITNPLLRVADVGGLSLLAHQHQARLVIDATFATPVALRPLDYGADVVVHSASKYLNGHSDVIAGAAVGSRKLMDRVWGRLLTLGGSLDPHACFLLERGMKTLPLRVRAQSESAWILAQFLQNHPKIRRVYHPFLGPQAEFARGQLRCGGGMCTFEVQGGDPAALALAQRLRIPKIATSLGGVESLVSLPYNTSHAAFTVEQRAQMGIGPGCVRYSVGLEDPADLLEDINQALSEL